MMTSSHLSRWARRALSSVALVSTLTIAAHSARAQETLDAAAAREHLTQGYKLKQQGALREALPHLVESLRLDPKLKTIINLADCEEKLAMLVEAQQHWLMARDHAGHEGEPRVKQEAEQHLAALGPRLPRLNIQLSPSVPPDAQVYRDDVLLGRVSLGTPLPTNPGEHKITVRAPGHDDWKYTLKLAERDNQLLTANVGPVNKAAPAPAPVGDDKPAPAAAPVATLAAEPQPLSPTPTPEPRDAPRVSNGSSGTTQKVLGIVAGGLGVISFGVSALYWQKARTDVKNEDGGRKLAQDDLLITNVTVASGAVLLTAGVILFVTAPSASSSASRVVPSLAVGKNTAVFGATGTF
jgi:hypothetical protein